MDLNFFLLGKLTLETSGKSGFFIFRHSVRVIYVKTTFFKRFYNFILGYIKEINISAFDHLSRWFCKIPR